MKIAEGIGWWSVACLMLTPTLWSCAPKEDSDEEETNEEEAVDISCDGAASHFQEICSDFMGPDTAELFAEDFRVDCIAMQGFYQREARCAARAESCEALLRCEISAVTFVCDTDEDCGGGLFCERPPEHCNDCVPDTDCVGCLSDEHCAEGKSCFDGLCILDENLFHSL